MSLIFNEWLDIFLKEKGLSQANPILRVTANESYTLMNLNDLTEIIKDSMPDEQKTIKNMLVYIDFNNGDVVDYYKHLLRCYTVGRFQ